MSNRSVDFTYITIWSTVIHLKSMYDLATVDQQRKGEAFALRVAVLTLAFFGLEAFLNHIIRAVRPDIWADERENFSGRKAIDGVKYAGPLGKLHYVHVLCGMLYDKNANGIAVVGKLKTFRNELAHARTREDTPADIQDLRQVTSLPVPRLVALATPELLVACVDEIQKMRLAIFDAAKRTHPNADLGSHPKFKSPMFQVIHLKQ